MFKRFACCLMGFAAWGVFAADAVHVGTNTNEANPFDHAEQWQDNYLPQDSDNALFYPLGDLARDEVVEHLFDPLVVKMHAKSVASFLHCDARSIRTANGGRIGRISCIFE